MLDFVHAIALSRVVLTSARSEVKCGETGPRRIARLRKEILLRKEEMRIKDARMTGIPAQRRPHYLPTERVPSLDLRAARGWSQAQASDQMLVPLATIAL